ncbi:hypothetical protein BDW22DRAFT_810373 [Trametopsis cervina]|nr:hypothetical protein BDW22DRAFT_810373 [Trametopsis cervina]
MADLHPSLRRDCASRTVNTLSYGHTLACIEVTTTGVAGVKAKAVQNAAQRANTTADNALSAFMDNIEQDPNVLVMFEGHGDNVTGRVVHNDVKGNQDMLFVSEVLQTYVNKLLWERLPALNSHKGLLLLTCGAAITAQHSRDNIIELVRSRRFSFAIAFARTSHHNFSGYEAALASVMSRQVRPQTQVWPHIHQPFLGMAQLRASPVVFVFRDRPDDEQITVRMLYSVENSFWGWLDPVRCGDMRCSGYLSATTLGGGWVSAKCSTCGSSSKIPAPEFVYDMKGGTATVPYPHPTNIPWHVKKHWKKK